VRDYKGNRDDIIIVIHEDCLLLKLISSQYNNSMVHGFLFLSYYKRLLSSCLVYREKRDLNLFLYTKRILRL